MYGWSSQEMDPNADTCARKINLERQLFFLLEEHPSQHKFTEKQTKTLTIKLRTKHRATKNTERLTVHEEV